MKTSGQEFALWVLVFVTLLWTVGLFAVRLLIGALV